MEQQLPELTGEESLGRTIVSSAAARRARTRGIIIREVFLEAKDAASISVDRLDHATPEVMAALASRRAHNRQPPRNFHGWAVLPVSTAKTNGRTVAASPLNGNPFHADIHLNIEDAEVRDAQKAHALELASGSQWLEAPE